MNHFFECKVKYETIDEQSGKQKKVNLPYIVDAMSYTEAESRIYAEMEQYVSGEFTIPSIKKANYTELFFYDDGDKWHKSKVVFVSVDEEAGKEKKVANTMLVLASDLKEAYNRIEESMKGMTVDFSITKIEESNIADIFVYSEEPIPEIEQSEKVERTKEVE